MNESLVRGVFEDSNNKNYMFKLVLACIASYADENGYCSLSQGKIAKYCSLSISSVKRSLKELEKDELFSIYREGSGCSIKTYYMLNVGREKKGRSRKVARVVSPKKTPKRKSWKKQQPLTEYQQYLASPKWRNFRAKILNERGHFCEYCGREHRLHLHHLTYDRIYNEHPDDVMILCEGHHKIIEDLKKQGKIPKLKVLSNMRGFTFMSLEEFHLYNDAVALGYIKDDGDPRRGFGFKAGLYFKLNPFVPEPQG